jgi:hypothetical protein
VNEKKLSITSILQISGLLDEDGILERPVRSTEWSRPAGVSISGRWLAFEFGWHLDSVRFGPQDARSYIRPARGMLESFARLEHADAADIANFARKWGYLGIFRCRDKETGETTWSLDQHFRTLMLWEDKRESRLPALAD